MVGTPLVAWYHTWYQTMGAFHELAHLLTSRRRFPAINFSDLSELLVRQYGNCSDWPPNSPFTSATIGMTV